MTEQATQKFPRRDGSGRIVSLVEMLLFVFLLLAVGIVMLSAIDALFWLLGFGEFGQISGWISALLAMFVFLDDFRAWIDYRIRWVVGGGALLLSAVGGLGIGGLMPEFWAPLFHGAIGAAVFVLMYTVLWFVGMRMMGDHEA
ncbi:MAG TPA: hypothetical protein H9881_17840 [Candidatus Stackebrandtia excrementipullorum]|nr:hypothetical protein [Candidatus Stackebrandtia excrementipullorum]